MAKQKEKHFDRIKAIKKASRAHAGPHGKAGPHADKRERRQRRMSTKDWLAEAEEEMTEYFPSESATIDLADVVRPRRFRVVCNYADDDGIAGSLGTLTVEAADEKAAIVEAMDRVWDPRLDAASCVPRFEAEELEEEDE